MPDFDAIIVGGGIAGVSLAWELSRTWTVALVERERFGGTQSTGRSAALFIHPYGTPTMSALARTSLQFLLDPPANFSETALLTPRSLVWLARGDQVAELDAISAQLRMTSDDLPELQANAAAARWPILDAAYLKGGKAVLDEGAYDIDVHALHSAYLRGFRERGGVFLTDAEVHACERDGKGWKVGLPGRSISARILINAAGAWADEIARMANATPVGLQAKRRTMVLLPPMELDSDELPCFIDTSEGFYFKPEGDSLLVSPADQTPVEPSDVQPDELDVAIAIDRLEQVTRIRVRYIAQKWAGLRVFAADNDPVIGWDASMPDFFWLAGQGGAGIMTSPAIAQLAAGLLRDEPLPADIEAITGLKERIAPDRFQSGASNTGSRSTHPT